MSNNMVVCMLCTGMRDCSLLLGRPQHQVTKKDTVTKGGAPRIWTFHVKVRSERPDRPSAYVEASSQCTLHVA